MNLGSLNLVLSEYSEGKIFISSCGPEGIICLITDNEVELKLIELILERLKSELPEILEEFIIIYSHILRK